MKDIYLLSCLALAGLGASVMAQDEERPGPGPTVVGGSLSGLLKTLDRDGNGALSAEELDRAPASLRKLDRDGDGTVESDELAGREETAEEGPRRAPGNAGGPPWGEMDKNGDGKISKEEAPARMVERWERMDGNGDGFIDKDEQAAMERMFRGMRERGGRPPGGGERPGAGGGRGGAGVWRVFSEKYDEDKNGEITAEEYGRSEERFAQLDKNKDGKLTSEDMTGGRRGPGAGNTVRGPDGPPQAGEKAPDFELPYATKEGGVKEGAMVKLSSFVEKKPVALIFGSYT